jgi:hypothetical protein
MTSKETFPSSPVVPARKAEQNVEPDSIPPVTLRMKPDRRQCALDWPVPLERRVALLPAYAQDHGRLLKSL